MDFSLRRQATCSEVYLSSVASIWSQIGGAYYSCANSMLDHISRLRNESGLTSYSLRLGPFVSEGIAKDFTSHFATMGISPFAPMEIWRLYLVSCAPIIGHLRFNLALLRKAFSLRGQWRLLDEFNQDISTGSSSRNSHEETYRPVESVQKSPSLVKEVVRDVILASLDNDDSEINFQDIDSLTAVEIARRLSSKVGMQLEATLIYDYPSVDAIVTFICQTSNDDEMIIKEKKLELIADDGPSSLSLIHEADTPKPHPFFSDYTQIVPQNRWDSEIFEVGASACMYIIEILFIWQIFLLIYPAGRISAIRRMAESHRPL